MPQPGLDYGGTMPVRPGMEKRTKQSFLDYASTMPTRPSLETATKQPPPRLTYTPPAQPGPSPIHTYAQGLRALPGSGLNFQPVDAKPFPTTPARPKPPSFFHPLMQRAILHATLARRVAASRRYPRASRLQGLANPSQPPRAGVQ